MGTNNNYHPYISLAFFTLGLNILLRPHPVMAGDLTSYFELESTDRARFVDDGQEIQLSLDQTGGSGLESYSSYLFGRFDMRIKLVPGDSAGTVITYYLTSVGPKHDELDFEFLGNVSGEPIILQTNVYASGVGGREQRIFLWFDPTADFHNYTFLWNEHQIVFYVDEVPIRVFPNIEAATGVPYLESQPMNIYGTIWDGDSWATQGGMIKINWTHAPFTVAYRDFHVDACADKEATSGCASTKWWNQGAYEALDASQLGQLKWVQDNAVYNYCTDTVRYNVTPIECYYNTPIASPPPSPSPSSSSSSSIPTGSPSSTYNHSTPPTTNPTPSSSSPSNPTTSLPSSSSPHHQQVPTPPPSLSPSPSLSQQSRSTPSALHPLPTILSILSLSLFFFM